MTADQYDAAVAAGQVSEEVQAQVSTAVSTQMSSSAVQTAIDSKCCNITAETCRTVVNL